MEEDDIKAKIAYARKEIDELVNIIKMYEAKIKDAQEIILSSQKSIQEICSHKSLIIFRGDASIGEQDYTECRICGKVLK